MKVSIVKEIHLLDLSFKLISTEPGEYQIIKRKNPFIKRGTDWYVITNKKDKVLGESVSTWNEWEKTGLVYIFYEESDIPAN